jgi:hypothetical protein
MTGDAALMPLERMLIEHECAKIVRHSLNLSDAREYARILDLFTEDAIVIRPSKPDEPLVGKAAIAADYAARVADRLTFHLCTNIVVDAVSREEAEAYCHVLLFSAEVAPGSTALPAATPTQYAGEYHDVLVRQDGRWRFRSRRGRMILRS